MSEPDRRIATAIAERVATNCTRHQYDEDSGRQISGRVSIRSQGEVRRLYRSSWHWYKAQLVTEGAWDHVYYNTQTRSLVCGERAWQQYMSGNGGQILFDEVVPRR